MSLFLDDGDVRLYAGDALEQLRLMPSESVHCIVTSPPFWGLRDYGTGSWTGGDEACSHTYQAGGTGRSTLDQYDNGLTPETAAAKVTGYGHATYRSACGKCGATRVDQQIGLEETPDEWCTRLVTVMREARRVLRTDGVCWIEVGDTYAAVNRGENAVPRSDERYERGMQGTHFHADLPTDRKRIQAQKRAGIKPKDLVGCPWLLAFALRADGWYLRSDTIWARPNPMPESVTDRPTKSHSFVFLLSKAPRYFYDADAIREPYDSNSLERTANPKDGSGNGFGDSSRPTVHAIGVTNPAGRNARSVWNIPTEPTPFAHFATFPTALVERCIKAGTSERGCCSECGAPWRRITERTDGAHEAHLRPKHAGHIEHGDASTSTLSTRGGSAGWEQNGPKREDVGWDANCRCGDAWPDGGPHNAPYQRPCVVLDPFSGSGTTALVARRLGRHAWGIELNEEYLKISATRLQQLSLFAGSPFSDKEAEDAFRDRYVGDWEDAP